MGWRVAQDCDLGLTLAHGGGYPGYGSHVMLMPDHGTGVFALANRTYAGQSTPAWDTAVAMDKAGLLKARSIPVSPTVADRKSTRLNSSHSCAARLPSSASEIRHRPRTTTAC